MNSSALSAQEYRRELKALALPISLQCLLQSSFSVVDQIMIGQLGSVSIAAVGLGGKFISLLTVVVQAIAAVSGILMAQAVGKRDDAGVRKGFCTNLALALALSGVFTALSLLVPQGIMGIYSEDRATVQAAASYLRVYSLSFLPMALTSLVSALLRCRKETKLPLYAGLCSAFLNTGCNYLLIYGNLGLPALGIQGAAWASVISQIVGCLLILLACAPRFRRGAGIWPGFYRGKDEWLLYLSILLPMFLCEFLWALGENVYGYIYGHMGTMACAAMTLINPLVSLTIGALSGVSQAAGIMMGQLLGEGETDKAYHTGKRLMKTGLLGSLAFSLALLLFRSLYVRIFQVEPEVRQMTQAILTAFALIFPIKVENMILGGGIIRSGGKTNYIMAVDAIGTWCFGVPIGFLSAFLLKLPIWWVYFLLSMEELVRLGITLALFRRKKWMRRL